ncbi:hypothetical protein [Brasilonema bromeliae]|uniref:Uncharacterized protein n=1 Tax=Brasilonema bromeliae SPC951 TaxID=385972 RepID=A0ABX1PAF8_9CYAN|nr:hypothetical protein [Brasilonema bromeliae]NMG20978.1 hypothetical protein [Brasilonema bromeliae SPC951]
MAPNHNYLPPLNLLNISTASSAGICVCGDSSGVLVSQRVGKAHRPCSEAKTVGSAVESPPSKQNICLKAAMTTT